MDEQIRLAFLVDGHDPLLDRRRRDIARADFDGQRVIEHLRGQQTNLVGERRGEQQGLALLGQHGIDTAQFLGKSQVKHAVCFIKDQRLQLGKLDRVLAMQIKQATGGRDQHVHAPAQLHHLRVDAHAAVSRVGGQRQVLGVLTNAFVNLIGQLAGRRQHQRANRIGRDFRAFHGQPLQQRQGKTSGLAGAGLRSCHQIAARQYRRNCLGLYRRRSLVTERFEGAQQGFDQAERGECHGNTVGKIQRKARSLTCPARLG